jgi:PIN domain nuclease of toxin-antitoxin system
VSLLILDTHAWLWWEANPERLSEAAAQQIAGAERLGVCTVSCWELMMLVARGRIALDRPAAHWISLALARERVEPIALGTDAAIEAAMLPYDRFPADPADRFIYSTARALGARLVTRDDSLRRYDPALAVW